jgi:putative membrane protein
MRTLPIASVAALVVSLVGGAAFAASNSAFLGKAIKGDNAEIQFGHLAEQKGASHGVRQFGHMLIADHTKAKGQATALAHKLGVKPPDGITAAAQSQYQHLKGMSGASFDHEFASDMVQDHQKVIASFKKQEHTGSKPTASLARKQLPTLRKHLRMAQELQKKTSGPNSK